MQMASSMTIYSSSSPASVWSQCSPHSSPSAATELENYPWTQPLGQGSAPRPVRGGLSCLFASTNIKHGSHSGSDLLEASCFPSSGIVRSSSQSDLSSLRETSDGRCVGVSISSSSLGMLCERSPISVLQGPLSHGSSNHSSHMSSLVARESMSNSHLPLDHHFVKTWKMASPLLDSWSSLAGHESIDGAKVVQYARASSEMLINETELAEDGKVTGMGAFAMPDEQIDIEEGDDSTPVGSGKPSREAMCSLSAQPTWTDPLMNFTEASSKLEILLPKEEFLINAQVRHAVFLDDLVIKAFRLADIAHKHQFRLSGDPYIAHCVETAVLLAETGADATVVAAGLLHDTIDDTEINEEQMRAIVGIDVTNLVVGVSKLSQFSQLARDKNIAQDRSEAERLRNMFLAMVDVQVVLIKLADRLHNLRTLEALSDIKKQRVAFETLEILTPIASRLGLWSWKSEIEDLCFKYLKPVEYKDLEEKLVHSQREEVVISAIELLDQVLQAKGVAFRDLRGRSKNLFSIYTKMMKKGRSINEIYDVRGLRVIVANEQSCYAALEAVHHLWPHIPGKLKDYIAKPKANGYQSLHTVVWVEGCSPLEIQIRTVDMHHHAEFGMAAHWRYKEGNKKYASFICQRVEWARWILTWHSEIFYSKLRVAPVEVDLRPPCPFPLQNSDRANGSPFCRPPSSDDDPLFVIMLQDDRMVIQEFPAGSTVGDLLMCREQNFKPLAAENRSACGVEMQPKVNHQIINNMQQKLQMGDLVELTPVVSSDRQQRSDSDLSLVGEVGDEERIISAYRKQIRRMYEDCRRFKVEGIEFQPHVVKTAEIAGLL
ncbi:hypothetical protein O6H91_12G011600 [Diphasiastrum complanatum]|uniref:Uncharacterized protein n=1 Tax=Diphasiastrum complanatum TaxID=34168 RepID=A0ACC2C010_DIPCM|nr:hypothetical protein O6H91_12G011600 [Diphasiastrum complanatum]